MIYGETRFHRYSHLNKTLSSREPGAPLNVTERKSFNVHALHDEEDVLKFERICRKHQRQFKVNVYGLDISQFRLQIGPVHVCKNLLRWVSSFWTCTETRILLY